jgi:UDP:flavonoid glycosyltransferase YjiC (YdhE family)
VKILFACTPADGHFNPLTGLAVHLKDAGHDVRWYAGRQYADKLQRLGIPHFAFKRARDFGGESLNEVFPERSNLRGLALMRFDLEKLFVGNVEGNFLDVQEIEAGFPFEVLFCDGIFLALTLVREKLGKHVCAVGLGTRTDDPPPGMGLKPARTPIGRLVYRGIRAAMELLVMRRGTAAYKRTLAAHGLAPSVGSIFDEADRGADVIFRTGVPGFTYPSRERSSKVKFAGPLLPARTTIATPFPCPEKLQAYERVILVSQGTVDNADPSKLIIPALQALKDTDVLLVVATGHSRTDELRKAYAQDNVIIEDFVDFDFILDHSDLFICNGGTGSVLLSLSKGVPLLGAGVREFKNDNNARIDYFRVGINLRTERPSPDAIRRAANRLLSEPQWKRNAERIRDEFQLYRPNDVVDAYLAALDGAKRYPAAHIQKGGSA